MDKERLVELAEAARKARATFMAISMRNIASPDEEAIAQVEYDFAYEEWMRAERVYRDAVEARK